MQQFVTNIMFTTCITLTFIICVDFFPIQKPSIISYILLNFFRLKKMLPDRRRA